MIVSRRTLFALGGGVAATALLPSFPSIAQSGAHSGAQSGAESVVSSGVEPALLQRALAALDRHGAAIANRDILAIADFSLASSTPRFHVVDVAGGRVVSHLVAHGRGSDPAHTGFLQRFSNAPRSNATSAGAYLTDGVYVGGHGRSLRLTGLDATNDNALSRGIVVHAAWYVSSDMARAHGVLGRSEGCFALSATSLPDVLGRLGSGHLIYADKI